MHLYAQIEEYLMQKIAAGSLRQGDSVETEEVLAAKFGVSRQTVRHALSRLVSQGYLYRIKGKGTFVDVPKLAHGSTSFISSYRREVELQGRRLLTEVLRLEVINGEKNVCGKLGLRVGKPVICLSRVRRVEGYNNQKPVVFTTVYIALEKFPQMTGLDFTSISLYNSLDANGLKVERAVREFEIVTASAEVINRLEISRFEPVIYFSSVGYLKDGKPIEYSESFYPAGSSKFLIEVRR